MTENIWDISVVIPTCDRPLWVQRALRSVRAQTHVPREIIVVDNGITPVPPETLPQGVTLLRLAPRVGVSSARNAGADRATGEFVAFLDDDDEWAPNYLAQMALAFQAAEAPSDLLIGRKDAITEGEGVHTTESCLYSTEDLLSELLVHNPGIGGQNIVVRRAAFLAVGGFDPALQVSEDRALAIDFLQQGKRLLPVPHAVVTLHRGRNDHLSKSPAMLEGTRLFYRKYRPLMDRRARLLNRSKILGLSAAQNRQCNWLLSKVQRLCSRFLKHLAEREEQPQPIRQPEATPVFEEEGETLTTPVPQARPAKSRLGSGT
ncbi:glycosyltransferase family 2 protein [Fodinicurvata fenggangensis]|uniref:glycosyltransferase family 2 protein n=1 Tax=Fodinicurvata fenggangensis TaxID=1121830 RepID=UPI00047A6142|nr:glycosyltransferase family 2 protein [Fodinicurvata fenggangensis]